MADITAFNTEVPTYLEDIADMPSRVRALASAFKDRLELDHSFGTSVDTSEIDCDGYHKQLTMPEFSGTDSETGNPITEPEVVTDGAHFFTKKIGGVHELCCQNETGKFQITDKGSFATEINELGDNIIDLTSSPYYSFYYNDGLFLAVGTNIYSSSDGITWTLRQAKTSGNFLKVIYGNSIYVAVSNYTIYTSSDGITWTLRKSYSSGSEIYSVTFGDGLFVAVGKYNTSYGRIYSSSDGITWSTAYTTSSSPSVISDITYGNNIFVAISFSGYYFYTSPDGVTWTQRNDPSDAVLYTVFFLNNIFLFGGSYGKIYSSSDGINLTLRKSLYELSNTYVVRSISYGDSVYLLSCLNSSNQSFIYSSADLDNWTLILSLTDYFYSIYYVEDYNSFFKMNISGQVYKTLKKYAKIE